MGYWDEPYEIPEPDYYTFVYEEPDNGWWLKIDSAEKLGDYHKKTESMYGECFMDYVNHAKEYEETGDYRVFENKRTYPIVLFGQRRHLTIMDAIIQFRLSIFSQQCDSIRDHGYILINKAGGYHGGPVKYTQFVHRKTFTWPDFKESDIRISQFPGGTHWYVHIGDMELREGEDIKWNSKSDARMAAMRYIAKEDGYGKEISISDLPRGVENNS